jgi:asparagine synthase (glutamine-hydrolysing)
MCGLVARLGPPAPLGLQPALAALAHRGPDGEGRWAAAGGRLQLGHRRLAVVGGASATQPVRLDEDALRGDLSAVLNGELYGWRAMAGRLRAEGLPVGPGDAGLLPALYLREGAGLGGALRGEFALVVADGRRRRLLALRDRFGVKPLVYATFEGALLIASEAKALFALGVPAALCPEALRHALAHQYLPPDRTLFAGVRRLPPGGRLQAYLDEDDLLHVEVDEWVGVGWPAADEAPRFPPPSAAALRAALAEAVALRLDSERPVGALLSGGLDSAAIVALACEAGGPIPCFTLRFPGTGFDEGAEAAALARGMGCPLRAVPVDHASLLAALPRAVVSAEGLCINGQLAARRLLSEAVREDGVVVVLSGEGSDELALGYPHLWADEGQALARLGAAHGPQRGLMLPLAGAAGVEAAEALLGFTPTFLRAKVDVGRRLAPLLRPGAAAGPDPVRALLSAPWVAAETAGRRRAHQSAALWARLCLGGYILQGIADAQEMAVGLEGRPPFLDPAVAAVLQRASVEQQAGPAGGKALLRAALVGALPPDALARPKHPFLAPPLLGALRGADARLIPAVSGALEAGLHRVPGLDPAAAQAWLRGALSAPAELDELAAMDAVLHTLLSLSALAAALPTPSMGAPDAA